MYVHFHIYYIYIRGYSGGLRALEPVASSPGGSGMQPLGQQPPALPAEVFCASWVQLLQDFGVPGLLPLPNQESQGVPWAWGAFGHPGEGLPPPAPLGPATSLPLHPLKVERKKKKKISIKSAGGIAIT